MGISINADKLAQAILKAIVGRFNKAVRQALPAINKRIGDMLAAHIKSSPAYLSLAGNAPDDLQAQFGIRNPGPILEEIIRVIQEELFVDYQPFRVSGKSIVGGVSWGILKSSYEGILNVAGVEYTSYNRANGTAYRIKWLDWLLTQGDKIIVGDHHIELDPGNPASRSGKAIMMGGGVWRVPPEFAGYAGNNFLTKALPPEKIKGEIAQIIKEEIMRRLT